MIIEIKGIICSDSDSWYYRWMGESYTTAKDVVDKIKKAQGEELIIKINSGGGDIFVASEIFTELKSYKGNVNIELVGLAASAASVIAMAGHSKMSPTALMMVHNVSSNASGDYHKMEHQATVLKKANKTIANAYISKTGMSEEEALALMDIETWLDASDALEKGLVDEIMFNDQFEVGNLTNFKEQRYMNAVQEVPEDKLNKIFNVDQSKTADFLLLQNAKKVANAKLNLLKIGGKYE